MFLRKNYNILHYIGFHDIVFFVMWKFVAILLIIIAAVAGFAITRNKPTPMTPSATTSMNQGEKIPQTVTASNSDSALNQTDQVINQNMNQMDQDLKDLNTMDQNSSEQDVNSL